MLIIVIININNINSSPHGNNSLKCHLPSFRKLCFWYWCQNNVWKKTKDLKKKRV